MCVFVCSSVFSYLDLQTSMNQTHEQEEKIPQHPQQHEHEKEEQKIDFIRLMQQQMCAGPSYLPNPSVCDKMSRHFSKNRNT